MPATWNSAGPLKFLHAQSDQAGFLRSAYGRTSVAEHRSRREHQYIDRLLLALDLVADAVHVADQAGICLDKDILPVRIERLAFGHDAGCCLLRAADQVDAGLASMLGELPHRRLADPAGAANKNGDKAAGESGGEARVRGLDICKGHHYCQVNGTKGTRLCNAIRRAQG